MEIALRKTRMNVKSQETKLGKIGLGVKKTVKRFSPAQTASLRANYNNGMVGIGKQYQVLMEKAATDAMLTINQVKVHYFFTITVLICHAPGYF